MSRDYIQSLKKIPEKLFSGLFGKQTQSKLYEYSSEVGRDALMKSTPVNLASRYRMIRSKDGVQDKFEKMRRRIFTHVENKRWDSQMIGGEPVVWKEKGFMGPKRPYFFVQPMDETGWLFEVTENGWIISHARKIVKENTFLRGNGVWDKVSLYESNDGEGTLRVSSPRQDSSYVSYAYYEQRLLEMFESELDY